MSHNEQNEVETSKHTEDSYRNEVSRLLEGHKTRFSKRLDKAHDKDFTIVDEIARWNRILIDEDAKPLINYDIYRKRKYWNLATGIRLGRRTFSSKSAEVEAYLKYLDWLKELPSKQIQPSQEQPSLTLNQIAPNELSPNELILRQEELFLKADSLKLERKKLNAELMADTSAPQQDTEAATDTQGGKFLSFNLTDEKKLEITKELGQYVDNPNLLEQLLSGKVVNDKIKITCQQNEFAEVFKRLEYNGETVQKSRFMIDWLCTNFIQSEGKQFNDRTIRDLFKASGKPPKTPICNFDWLTFKEPTQLAKEAQAKLIESYPT